MSDDGPDPDAWLVTFGDLTLKKGKILQAVEAGQSDFDGGLSLNGEFGTDDGWDQERDERDQEAN